MPKITDVSPVKNAPAVGHSVIGRMLSVACTPDGKTQYIGSYSNLWVSGNDGQSWERADMAATGSQPVQRARLARRMVRDGYRDGHGLAGRQASAVARPIDSRQASRHRRLWRLRSVDGAEQWQRHVSGAEGGASRLW